MPQTPQKKPDCNDFILKNASAYNDAATMYRENQGLQQLPGMAGYEYAGWAMFGSSGSYSGLDRAWTAEYMQSRPWASAPPAGAGAILHTHTWNPLPSGFSNNTGDVKISNRLNIPIYVLSSGGINKYDPSSNSIISIAGPGWDKRNSCDKK